MTDDTWDSDFGVYLVAVNDSGIYFDIVQRALMLERKGDITKAAKCWQNAAKRGKRLADRAKQATGSFNAVRCGNMIRENYRDQF